VVEIWTAYNTQIAQVMSSMPASRRAVRCVIGNNEPMTLEALMEDYIRHLEHHLAQIIPTEAVARA
jgi:hypothetical protein